jgi:predicted lipoprotein with Yx(FWY)xxD motif
MRKMVFLTMLAAGGVTFLGASVTAATGSNQAVARRRTVVISTRRVPKLGTVLVDSKGRTLYMFVPDKRRKVTCVKTCAVVWPPVMLPKGAKPVAKGTAKASLLGSDRDPAGGRVVTYNRWPLYTYISDRAPGQATGQALDLNGGLWYVLTPRGTVLRKKL